MVNIKLLERAPNVYLMNKLNRLSSIKTMSKSKEKNPFSLVELLKKKENKFKSSIVNNCQFVNAYTLTTQDKTAINKIYPNFSFKYLSEFSYNGHKNNVTNGEKMIYTFYRRLRLIEEISKILL